MCPRCGSVKGAHKAWCGTGKRLLKERLWLLKNEEAKKRHPAGKRA